MYELYSEPAKLGLRTIGEVDFSDGCYQFDYTVVWQDVETGALYFADDSGCSCPSPFEGHDRSTLTKIDRPQTLIDHLEQRKTDAYNYGLDWAKDETARIDADCAELINKTREAARA